MDPATELSSLALHRDVLFAAVGVFAALRAIHAWPLLSKTDLYRRVLPILPEVMGIAIAYTGGIPIVAALPESIRIATGFWVGFLSQRAHKVLGQTILGDDPALQAKRRAPRKNSKLEKGGGA